MPVEPRRPDSTCDDGQDVKDRPEPGPDTHGPPVASGGKRHRVRPQSALAKGSTGPPM